MPVPRLTERSLYPPLVKFLGSIGFESISEVEIGGRFPDLVAKYKSEKFVVQVRIDGGRVRQSLLRDAYIAARKAETMNVVTLVYPHDVRRPVADEAALTNLALRSSVISDVFTSYLTTEILDSAENVFRRIREAADLGTRSTDIGTAVRELSSEVAGLAITLRRVADPEIEPVLQSVVGRFDLFMALGDRSPEETRAGAMDLTAYLLLNQLLFYHIYSEKTGEVDPLPVSISSLRDLTKAFRDIRRIDFAPVYSIELSELLPARHEGLVEAANAILAKLRLVRPENVELDLLGRFFHELLPWKTRKIFAAFYTHPISGEIAAGLSIDHGDAHVMDMACGSGTLLVAAYRRKLGLLAEDKTAVTHNKLLRELTGVDLMPFAAHLTAVNLSVQSAKHKADYLRVGAYDSLELLPRERVKPFSRQLQTTLYGASAPVRSGGAVGAIGEPHSFVLDRPDVILINPPFTDREKMPDDFRAKLNAKLGTPETRRRIQRLIDLVGGSSNLWAYFVALSHIFLKGNGVLCAILPTNILRGKNSRAVRSLLLEQYHPRYLVRACRDYGFTEGSELRDLLVVAEKEATSRQAATCLVWVKKSVRSLNEAQAQDLVEAIRRVPPGAEVETELFDAAWVNRNELLAYRDNLTPVLSYSSLRNQKVIRGFLRLLEANTRGLLARAREGTFFEGFHTSPKGRSKVLCLTRPISQDRLEHALLKLETVDDEKVEASFEDTRIVLKRQEVLPALRSLTSLRRMDVSGAEDFIAIAPYPAFSRVAQLASWRGSMDWDTVEREARSKLTQLAIPRKFNFYSPNFHLFGFYDDSPYTPFDFLKGVRVDNPGDARILCLFFNSIAFISQAFAYREETQVRFPELREEDLGLLQILDVSRLSAENRSSLLKLFDRLRRVEFPSLTDQLELKYEPRVALDREILRLLEVGPDARIDEMLDLTYGCLVAEFKATRGLRKKEFRVY